MRSQRLLATVARLRRALMLPGGVLSCRRSVRVSVAVVLGSFLWGSTAHAADRIYWSNADGTISYANLDGSAHGKLQITGVPVDARAGIGLDPAANRIYWADFFANKISFANLDGSGGGDVRTGQATIDGPYGLAVDPAAGKIYWSNYSGDEISYAGLDGSGGGNIDTGQADVTAPHGVALDPAVGKIYWSNGDDKISFASLDGSGGRDVSTTFANVDFPLGVALDSATQRLYWANEDGTTPISFANLNSFGGGNLRTVGAPDDSPIGVALDPAAGRIYWANEGNGNASDKGEISYANVDGSGGGPLVLSVAEASAPQFVALLEKPVGSGVPTITVAPSGGSASCSSGAWASDDVGSFLYRSPHTFAYQWSLDGVDIAGATASTYSPAVAGEYRCSVTASNEAGGADQTSAPRDLNPPPGSGKHSPGGGGNQAPGKSNRSNGGAGRATTARIWALRETHSRFAVASASTPPSARAAREHLARGTVFSFRLDQPAAVKIAIQTRARVRRVGHRCLAPTRNRSRDPRCIRPATLAMLTRGARHGSNRVSFTGRIAGRALAPGGYQARFTAIDVAGVSSPQTLRFTIVR